MNSKEKKRQAIKKAQDDANAAKERLISIMYELEEAGAIRQARSLEKIIARLEVWQNK